MNPVKLIIFDLDDTLVSGENIYAQALSSVGISSQDEYLLRARADVKSKLASLAPSARNRFIYLKNYLQLTLKYSAQKSFELGEAYENEVVRLMAIQWKKLKRDELFASLRQTGVKISVLTNETCRLQSKKLAAFEQGEKYFDFLLTSEEMGVEKPNIKLFQETLRHFNLGPKDVWMVGDSFENDIKPCLLIGLRCFQTIEFKNANVDDKSPVILQILDEILEHL
jgi:putative hydrolase of the HAD superfamily